MGIDFWTRVYNSGCCCRGFFAADVAVAVVVVVVVCSLPYDPSRSRPEDDRDLIEMG